MILEKKVKYYHRCVSKDELYKMPCDTGCYIINMDNSDKPGSHWVALFIDTQKRPYYFDSFGCIYPLEVEAFMKRTGKPLQYSKVHVQNINSNCCGYYCMYFCLFMTYHMGRTEKFDEFLGIFDGTNELKNRNILIKRLRLLKVHVK
jgi:hypothetical protein